MKLAILAAVAAIGMALAAPSQAATFAGTKADVASHNITQAACHWHSKRIWVPRHHGHRGHYVHRRVKVCH